MHIEYTAEQLAIQPKLSSANINPESFLATDYLNHFNEIVMLLEMIPDMPELIEDAADWQPKSYTQHFADSGFHEKQLAIEAFEKAPTVIRTAFDKVCGELDKILSSTIAGLNSLNIMERGIAPAAQDLIRQRITHSQELLMKLNQVVHGKLNEDEYLTDTPSPEEPEAEDVQSQADIDKLFD